MGNAKIRVLLIEPKEHPKSHEIQPTRHAFEKAVNVGAAYNGKVEAKRLEHGIYAMYNKDRFLSDLVPNRRIGDDILCGVFYVVAENEDGELISLTSEQQEHYSRMFERIEYIDQAEIDSTVFFRFL